MKNYKIRKNKPILFISFFVLFVVLLINVYVNDRIKTKFAETINFQDTLYLSGFIVRDEEVIYSQNPLDDKYISFSHREGDKLSKNLTIASIHSSYNSSLLPHKIENIENEIQIINKINSVPMLHNDGISAINETINSYIEKLSLAKSNFEFLKLKDISKDILYLINIRSKILGKYSDNSSKIISDLEIRKNNMSESKNVINMTMPSSGNVVRYVDGFENTFDYKNLLNLKSLNFESITPNDCQANLIGKIIKSQTSYILFNISDSDAKRIKEYNELYLSIDDIDCFQNIPCKVESLKKYNDSSDYILIVSFDVINENIISLRKENFKISARSYSGIKVDKSAIHLKDNESQKFGVYVKYGKYNKFKDINIIFANDDFVICSYGPDYYNNENYLQPGDKIITQGKNLKK